MQKGLQIQFTEDGPQISVDTLVTGTAALDQNMIISIATAEGSDMFFPERGSKLEESFLRYGYVSQSYAQHQANFAAIGAKIFYRKTKDDTASALESIRLEAGRKENNKIRLRLRTQYANNNEVDTTVIL